MTKVTTILYDNGCEKASSEEEGYLLFTTAVFTTLIGMLIAFAALSKCGFSNGLKEKSKISKMQYEIVQLFVIIVYVPLGRGVLPNIGIEVLLGIIMGYEVCGLVVEYLGYIGKPRATMIGHHLGCVTMGLTCYFYFYSLPLVERQFWWISYNVGSYMMDSNIPLNLRNIFRGVVIFDVAFALTFFYSRFYLVYCICTEFVEIFGVPWPELPWRYHSTTAVYALLGCFTLLNVYWGVNIVGMVIHQLTKKKKKKGA